MMPFSAAHDLIAGIIAACRDVMPDVNVSDGFFVSEDGTDVLMVGVSDIDGTNGNAVEGERDWATTGLDGSSQETSSILCAAVSFNGDGDQELARSAVWSIAGEVATLCRIEGGTDPAFGVPYALWTQMGRSFSLDQPATADGAVAILKFRIYYEARV